MNKQVLIDALCANLNWFENSGVMVPDNGMWGVAERVSLKTNPSMEKIYRSFPAWTESENCSIIEQRRSDCNFQAALLFLLASDTLKVKKYREIANNILDFLYFRSGMLNRFPSDNTISGAWYWSHINRSVWFDDNSWNCCIPLLISEKYPELDRKYELKKWALTLADSIAAAYKTHFQIQEGFLPAWSGNLKLPHWGSLVCMALSKAYAVSPDPEYREVIDLYHTHLVANKDTFIASEQAYAMLGSTCCYSVFKDEKFKQTAEFFGDKLIKRMDPATGNLPAEHNEAPTGSHLVDTIYTVNWALLGFQNLHAVSGKVKYRTAFLNLLQLLVKIQDKSPENHVCGCWRGMYDLQAQTWGGGDCYEGGANSIYTGWTNAPVAFCIALELLGDSIIKFLPFKQSAAQSIRVLRPTSSVLRAEQKFCRDKTVRNVVESEHS